MAAGPTTRTVGFLYSSDVHLYFAFLTPVQQRRLGVDRAAGVAVAEFFRAERGDPLGIAGRLRRTERFDVFRNRIFVRAGKSRDDAHESNAQAAGKAS